MRRAHCCNAAYPLPKHHWDSYISDVRGMALGRGPSPGISLLTVSSRDIGSVTTMNRMIKQKAAARVARETGLAALNRFGSVLVNSVRRHFKRTAIERELGRLDERMLSDL